jgi:hypothetical protein
MTTEQPAEASAGGHSFTLRGALCRLMVRGKPVAKLYGWQITVLPTVANGRGFILTASRGDLTDYWQLPRFLCPPLELHIPWGAGMLVATVQQTAPFEFMGVERPQLVKGEQPWRD